jgi:signal transduction histidine kinase
VLSLSLRAIAPLLALALERQWSVFEADLYWTHVGVLRQDLQRFQRGVFRSQEEERFRLASLLHDGPLQHAARLQSTLAALGDRGKTVPAAGHAGRANHVDQEGPIEREVQVQLADLTASLRGFTMLLWPAVLTGGDLLEALEDLAERARASGEVEDMTVELVLPAQRADVEVVRGMAEETRLALYRVAEAAVDAAVRRGHPRRLRLALTVRRLFGTRVAVEIDDDGGHASSARQRGLDLSLLEARLAAWGGEVVAGGSVTYRYGTAITGWVPALASSVPALPQRQ